MCRFQESIGIDMLVHGEFERNDMVEYFGEHLEGFAFTSNGWVQSFGTRYVKPPIIFGDISRPNPMTVYWSQYAQTLSKRPMKGMLTGTGHHPAVELRTRRSAARDYTHQIGPGDPRRSERPRSCWHRRDPDRRTGLPRRAYPCAAATGNYYLDWAVRAFSAQTLRRKRRHPDPHPHVLLRVQ